MSESFITQILISWICDLHQPVFEYAKKHLYNSLKKKNAKKNKQTKNKSINVAFTLWLKKNPHHGHAKHEWGDIVDGRLIAFVQCVEKICPAHNPQQKAKCLRANRETKGEKTNIELCKNKEIRHRIQSHQNMRRFLASLVLGLVSLFIYTSSSRHALLVELIWWYMITWKSFNHLKQRNKVLGY